MVVQGHKTNPLREKSAARVKSKINKQKTQQIKLAKQVFDGIDSIFDSESLTPEQKVEQANNIVSQANGLDIPIKKYTIADIENKKTRDDKKNMGFLSKYSTDVEGFNKSVMGLNNAPLTPEVLNEINLNSKDLLDRLTVAKAGEKNKDIKKRLELMITRVVGLRQGVNNKANQVEKNKQDESKQRRKLEIQNEFKQKMERWKWKNKPDTKNKNTKIKEIMDTYSVDRKTALGIVNKTLKINTNPQSGDSVIVDLVTGKSKPIKATGVVSPAIEREAPKQTLYEMADLTAGVVSGVKAAYGRLGGQVGLTTAKKTDFARQRVTTAAQNLIKALSINSRYPVMEQKRIEKEVNIKPSILDSAQSLRSRMRGIDDFLKKELKENEFISKNPNMTVTERANATKKINVINSFRTDMGVPQEKTTEIKTVTSNAEWNALPSGTKYKDPKGVMRTKK